MQLTETQRGNFIRLWVLVFYILAFIKWLQGLWLYQFAPFMFNTRFDGVSWLFMQTGLHRWLLLHAWGQIGMDLLFYACPLLYFFVWRKNPEKAHWVAWVWLIINWVYVQAYTLFPTNSIEAHTAWLLFPLLFCARSLTSFNLLLQGLRYFFLYFFCSAAVWKLVQGGAFEPLQMSAILMEQHKEFLVTSPHNLHADLLYGLINHPNLSFALYWFGIVVEAVFVTGFFTRRFDKWLAGLFILFLLFDYLVMRIPYFEVMPLLLTLLFAQHKNTAPLHTRHSTTGIPQA